MGNSTYIQQGRVLIYILGGGVLPKLSILNPTCTCISDPKKQFSIDTVYTRVQVERVYKLNPIFEAQKYNFFRKKFDFLVFIHRVKYRVVQEMSVRL